MFFAGLKNIGVFMETALLAVLLLHGGNWGYCVPSQPVSIAKDTAAEVQGVSSPLNQLPSILSSSSRMIR
jgi:hypothetical protein